MQCPFVTNCNVRRTYKYLIERCLTEKHVECPRYRRLEREGATQYAALWKGWWLGLERPPRPRGPGKAWAGGENHTI